MATLSQPKSSEPIDSPKVNIRRRLPCIVSGTGGPRELVTHGEDGFITKSLDANDLSMALLRLIEEPSLRKKMAENSRSKVERRDWNEAFANFWNMSPE